MKGRTNASIDSSSYRWIGKEIAITPGDFKTFTGSGATQAPCNVLPAVSAGDVPIVEQDGTYGYYQGRKSYTTKDVMSIDASSASPSRPMYVKTTTMTGALGTDEYFLVALGAVNTAGSRGLLVINDEAGLGGLGSTLPSDNKKVGSVKYKHPVNSSISTLDLYATKDTSWIKATATGTVRLRCWNIVFTDYDFGIIENGGGSLTS